MIKLLLAGFIALGLGLGVLIKALVLITRGERYRFGHLDGGVLLTGRSTSPWGVLVGALVYLAGAMLLLAWPLGLYERFEASRSVCHAVVTQAELHRLGGPTFSEYEIQELGSACSARARDDHNDRFELTVDGFGGSWRGRGVAWRLASGRLARMQQVPGARLLRVEHGRAALEVSLPERAFDESDARAIAELLDERRELSARYSAQAGATPSSGGRLVRRAGPYVCPALVGLALLVAGLVLLRRRSQPSGEE